MIASLPGEVDFIKGQLAAYAMDHLSVRVA